METLQVSGLCKKYPAFELKNVSFELESGKITGFIGRNGAGKTTTLKSILHFVHPDAGKTEFFGMDMNGHEMEIKQKIGFVSGGIDYYQTKKLKSITAVTKTFYENWDQDAYERYLKLFALDEEKTPAKLSAGMKVKYALALALSHNASLLILDEPTSGLDPVSRDELMDIFLNLCDEGKTILFSTHITSDLDKCADNIIYIKQGTILAEAPLKQFTDSYRLIEGSREEFQEEDENLLIGAKRSKEGMSAIVKTENIDKVKLACRECDLDTIMVHLEKGEE